MSSCSGGTGAVTNLIHTASCCCGIIVEPLLDNSEVLAALRNDRRCISTHPDGCVSCRRYHAVITKVFTAIVDVVLTNHSSLCQARWRDRPRRSRGFFPDTTYAPTSTVSPHLFPYPYLHLKPYPFSPKVTVSGRTSSSLRISVRAAAALHKRVVLRVMGNQRLIAVSNGFPIKDHLRTEYSIVVFFCATALFSVFRACVGDLQSEFRGTPAMGPSSPNNLNTTRLICAAPAAMSTHGIDMRSIPGSFANFFVNKPE